jgi:hypothetical protein
MDGHLGTSLTHPIGIFGLLGRAGVPWSVGRGLSASQLVGEGLALRRQGKDMRRIGDVLQPLLAEIDELGGDRTRTWRQASAEMQMPPGAASPSRREATLAPWP